MGIRFGLILLVAVTAIAGPVAAQVVDQGTSVEGCVGCHALGTAVPVGNVNDHRDPHFVDLHPKGPETSSGYRQLVVTLTLVNVTGAQLIVDFTVEDEEGRDAINIFESDGRVVLAKLVDGSLSDPPASSGDPTEWQRIVSESFDTNEDGFEALGGASYRYTTSATPIIAAGDPLRAVVEISAGDIPAGNGWCDFEADKSFANGCGATPELTRDIVQTATCNGCHGVTSDTRLAFHGNGGRTEVEYCVTCHNPPNFAEDMTTLIHKIHNGAFLTQEYRDGKYEDVIFTRDRDNCTACHMQGGEDEENWKSEPNRDSCGSCHDDVNFDTGANHGSGGQQQDNRYCVDCHPSEGEWTGCELPFPPVGKTPGCSLPVPAVHQGVARADEAGLYRGEGNGYALHSVSWDRVEDQITVDYSVTRGGERMVLQSDPRWSKANGAGLSIRLAWSSEEYTNEGSKSMPAPAQPVRIDGLDVGGAVSEVDEDEHIYRVVTDTPAGAFDNVTVAIDGHPQADLRGLPVPMWVSIPVRSVFEDVNVEPRGRVAARRRVIDIDKCNACHDTAGAGLSLHGNNRVSEMQVCVLCHNGDATDIGRRPPDPEDALDGKREESVDIKRMIHQIHTGENLTEGIVIYGFSSSPDVYVPHDFSHVRFVGNNKNCLTCHEPGTYSADAAWRTLSSTVDTGSEVTDPKDNLNISPLTSACSSCHDSERAKDHMILNGGTFGSLDENIAIAIAAVPEPAGPRLPLAALAALGALARRGLGRNGRCEDGSGFRDERRRALKRG
ncbi:MAG: OmcA/MtrC family decaheme c-type cytochrome [Deltaproteobacteria bacterium]|nr:OmcA/MtrC family decaheme c-type cytochrome [Deltaproteobacteria bacterium]